jgi:hypothetical protein
MLHGYAEAYRPTGYAELFAPYRVHAHVLMVMGCSAKDPATA